ncbi:dehydrogenase [Solimonas fluminis]|uniref:Dehydrogenase n=1 Tax=Solimonas fluminis TaxID=2086571 RepID=A0A2S5TE23_9GAMM|nr:glucose 1-dehydrogenase [Solimonas fluminis]PPE73229.1 dehydrogenase [Solimonas fluminis]
MSAISRDEFRLEGKVALITGAAQGIGAECARVFAAAGATVMLSDRQGDAGRAMTASITAAGGRAAYRDLDVTREQDWIDTIGATVTAFGGLDILVNNAGIEIMGPITDIPQSEFQRLAAVNIEGVFLGCKHAVIAMRPGGPAGRGGSIVNLSSVAGLIGVPWLSAYGASKGAVRLLTKDVAVECGRLGYGIRCNSIHPGVVETEMADSFLRKNQFLANASSIEEIRAAFLQAHPIGRLGRPSDVANAARFLASDAASWITGVELPVDGGWTAS